MPLTQLQELLTANRDNAEINNYLRGVVMTPEGVNSFLETEDGQKLIQPKIDSHFTKGLETWKANHLTKIIEDEVAKRNPAETPEQKTIRELKERLDKADREGLRTKLTNMAITQATSKGLPLELVEYFVGADEETTLKNLTTLEATWQATLQAAVEAKFKEGGREPHNGGGAAPSDIQKLEKELEEARTKGNTALVIALKNKIYALQQSK